jgi:hypothetical protein
MVLTPPQLLGFSISFDAKIKETMNISVKLEKKKFKTFEFHYAPTSMKKNDTP